MLLLSNVSFAANIDTGVPTRPPTIRYPLMTRTRRTAADRGGPYSGGHGGVRAETPRTGSDSVDVEKNAGQPCVTGSAKGWGVMT